MSARSKATLGVSRLLAALALVCVPSAARAQQAAADLKPVTTVEGITEYDLSNGLRVLLFPDHSKPQMTVNITYLVGSRNESYGETGMAHLLEHLMFKGTPKHTDISQELTERGAQPNGTTWFDRTNYFEVFPASEDNLTWALDLEADRMVNSFIAKKDLESEMTVVRNEMEAGENSPANILQERVLSTAYLWHNYGHSTIGARSDVEDVPIERLQAFYHKYYQPDNAVLVVAGDIDPQKTLQLVVDKFGALPRPDRTGANRIYPTYTTEPTQDGERMVTLRRVGDVKYVTVMYHIPPGSDPSFPAVDVLAYALGDTPSGRLYKALVEPQIATRVSSNTYQLREAGPLFASAEVRKEGDLDQAWKVLDETVQGVLTKPITGEEVQRAKTAMLKQFDLFFTNSTFVALQLSDWAAMGDWRLFFLYRDRLAAVTADDVNRVAQAYLKPSNRTVGLFYPTDHPDRAVVPTSENVDSMVAGYTGKVAVAEGEAFDPSPANVDSRTTTFTLPDGMKVAFLNKKTRGNAVTVRLRLQFGDAQSLKGRSTAGDFAGSMLMRGTTKHTRQQIQDELDRLKASGSLGGNATMGSGGMTTVRQSLPDVIRLLAEISRSPSFPADEFQTLKEQQIAQMEAAQSEPAALAQIALLRRMDPWPEDSPRYHETIDESIARTKAVTLDQVKAFYNDFYGPQSGNLVIVGDFDPAQIRPVVEEAFGGWKSPHAYHRIAATFHDLGADSIQIETPDKANAYFFAQQNLELKDTDRDYPAMVLAGYMIGGGFLNSRLASRIRQKDGLSYGVGGYITGHPIDPVGSFFAYAIYAPENGDKLVADFNEEIQKVLDSGFTADEVDAAKTGWLQSQQLARAQDASLAGQISSNLYFDRTFKHDADLESKVKSLTPAQINAAVRRYLDLSKITIVKAGDFAKAKAKIG
jgi:zinc protease